MATFSSRIREMGGEGSRSRFGVRYLWWWNCSALWESESMEELNYESWFSNNPVDYTFCNDL